MDNGHTNNFPPERTQKCTYFSSLPETQLPCYLTELLLTLTLTEQSHSNKGYRSSGVEITTAESEDVKHLLKSTHCVKVHRDLFHSHDYLLTKSREGLAH